MFYSVLKNKINSDSPIISQFVLSNTVRQQKAAVFMNILRQINVKLGGDLWHVVYPEAISKKSMVIGIDVCHKGRQSIIGYVSTYDTNLCKYYTQASPQKQKGIEIISSNILREYLFNSLQAYKDFNKGTLPDHIFIYRDGVGDAMRKLVLEKELSKIKETIKEEYEEAGKPLPKIVLIIVNKRVRQRFF